MTDQELREIVADALHRIAPECDAATLPGDADLRETLDLDSMDVLNFFVALHERLNVDIAESDYRRLGTIDGCVNYLQERLKPNHAASVDSTSTAVSAR